MFQYRMRNFQRFLKIASIFISAIFLALFLYILLAYNRTKKEFLADLESSRTANWVKYEEFPKLLVETTILIEDPHFRECSQWAIWKQYYRVFFRREKELNRCGIGTYVARMVIQQKQHFGMLTWHYLNFASTLALFGAYSNDQILEEFLNRVYMGAYDGKLAYGYKDGAQGLFHKELRNLTQDQIAALVGLVSNPAFYSPLKNEDRSWQRAEFVLQKMQEAGLIPQKK
jgi:membrane peptidoglycan carboxypeptidase